MTSRLESCLRSFASGSLTLAATSVSRLEILRVFRVFETTLHNRSLFRRIYSLNKIKLNPLDCVGLNSSSVLSPLPPSVVERKTLVVAGHVTTRETFLLWQSQRCGRVDDRWSSPYQITHRKSHFDDLNLKANLEKLKMVKMALERHQNDSAATKTSK